MICLYSKQEAPSETETQHVVTTCQCTPHTKKDTGKLKYFSCYRHLITMSFFGFWLANNFENQLTVAVLTQKEYTTNKNLFCK